MAALKFRQVVIVERLLSWQFVCSCTANVCVYINNSKALFVRCFQLQSQ